MAYDKKYSKKSYGNGKKTVNREPLTMNREPKVHREPKVNREPLTVNHEPLTVNREPLTVHHEPRLRRLAPLMTEEAKATASIHELSYDFGCRITRLFQYLTEDAEYREYIQSKQLYRSGTSVGANVRESKHAQSEADFLSKMSIAYKEADESDYWLNLLHDNGYLNDDQFNSLKKDIDRILRILSSIVKTMKEKIEAGKKK